MPQAALKSITPILPRALPMSAVEKVNTAIAAHLDAVEALTAFLDAADGDPDISLDESDDEPSLGGGSCDDREFDESEIEPSLGSLPCDWHGESQDQWAGGNTNDAEGDEHDGSEDGGDDEPSLAHGNDANQERATLNITGMFSVAGGPSAPRYSDLEAEHDGREPDEDREPEPQEASIVSASAQ